MYVYRSALSAFDYSLVLDASNDPFCPFVVKQIFHLFTFVFGKFVPSNCADFFTILSFCKHFLNIALTISIVIIFLINYFFYFNLFMMIIHVILFALHSNVFFFFFLGPHIFIFKFRIISKHLTNFHCK